MISQAAVTRDEFGAYWKDIHGPNLVPLAEKYGFIQYQQFRTFGKLRGETPELVDFGGIAMFLVTSPDSFKAAVEDLYYLNVVQPDEYNLMDKSAPGREVVASFHGFVVPIVQNGVDATGNELNAEVLESRNAFVEVNGAGQP